MKRLNVLSPTTYNCGVVRHQDVSLVQVERWLRVVHRELVFYNRLFTGLRLQDSHTHAYASQHSSHMHEAK